MVVPTVPTTTRRRRKPSRRGIGLVSLGLIATSLALVALSLLLWRWCFRQHDSRASPRVWIPPSQRLRPSRESLNAAWTPPRMDVKLLQNQNNSISQRFLIFRPPFETAQGVGNLMNGLLAAHLLGREFERIVCVSQEWQDFYAAFEILHPHCLEQESALASASSSSRKLWLLDFSKLPLNECELKRRLQGPDAVLTLVANTYPQWPSITATDTDAWQFQHWYRCKFALPWNQSPTTVVHLRQPDPTKDSRAGMNPETWHALGVLLGAGKDTYLVTNQVDLYHFFETNFGWSHPPWKEGIQHSALTHIQWTTKSNMLDQTSRRTTTTTTHEQQQQQLWSDWWTIYQAKTVYHTHSDFSRSATRWSLISTSYRIIGLAANGTVLLKLDKDENEQLFSQRRQLQHCELQSSGLDGLGHVLNLDDEMHDDLVEEIGRNVHQQK